MSAANILKLSAEALAGAEILKEAKKPRARKEKTEEPAELKFADLSGLLAGEIEMEKPSISPVSQDFCLFYAGAVNEIHGEPSVGKSNIVAASVIAELLAGGSCLVLDPEDTPVGFVQKIRSLSQDSEQIKEAIKAGKLHYLHNPEPGQIAAAQAWALENKPSLVVLDGLAEALANEGLNEDIAGDVLSFFRRQIRPFAEQAGAAVLVADHVTKNGKAGSWARGSGAKLGRYDGVSYEIKLGKPYSPAEAGFVRLTISKDRKGGIGSKGKTVADLHFIPSEKGTETRWEAGQEVGEPTEIMRRIVGHLEAFGETNLTALRAEVSAKTSVVSWAVQCLAKAGKVEIKQKGKSKVVCLRRAAA